MDCISPGEFINHNNRNIHVYQCKHAYFSKWIFEAKFRNFLYIQKSVESALYARGTDLNEAPSQNQIQNHTEIKLSIAEKCSPKITQTIV